MELTPATYKIKILDGTNYAAWSTIMSNHLRVSGLLGFVEGTVTTPNGTAEERETFERRKSQAFIYIVSNVHESLQQDLLESGCPKESWAILKRKYSKINQIGVHATYKSLYNLKWSTDECMQAHIDKIKSMISLLRKSGETIKDSQCVHILLQSLPPSYDFMVSNILHSAEMDWPTITDSLLLEADRRKQSRANQDTDQAAAFLAKMDLNAKPAHNKKKFSNQWPCYFCQRSGHTQRECPDFKKARELCLARSEKNNKTKLYKCLSLQPRLSSNNNMSCSFSNPCNNNTMLNFSNPSRVASITLLVQTKAIQNRGWVFDSGATNHVATTVVGATEVTELPVPHPIKVGDGLTVYAYKTGSFPLLGLTNRKDLTNYYLGDVLICTDITVSLISVSCLNENGFKVTFSDGKCTVEQKGYPDNLPVLTGTEIDGLYYLDGQEITSVDNLEVPIQRHAPDVHIEIDETSIGDIVKTNNEDPVKSEIPSLDTKLDLKDAVHLSYKHCHPTKTCGYTCDNFITEMANDQSGAVTPRRDAYTAVPAMVVTEQLCSVDQKVGNGIKHNISENAEESGGPITGRGGAARPPVIITPESVASLTTELVNEQAGMMINRKDTRLTIPSIIVTEPSETGEEAITRLTNDSCGSVTAGRDAHMAVHSLAATEPRGCGTTRLTNDSCGSVTAGRDAQTAVHSLAATEPLERGREDHDTIEEGNCKTVTNTVPGSCLLLGDAKTNIQNGEEEILLTDKNPNGNTEHIIKWHERMGHICEASLRKMVNEKLVEGVAIKPKTSIGICEICNLSKKARSPFPTFQKSNMQRETLGLVHSDICGPLKTTPDSNNKYVITFLDEHTKYCWVYVINYKSDALKTFKTWKQLIENQLDKKVKILRTDRGGEYTSNEFKAFLQCEGIRHEMTSPHTPQQNGAAERLNRTLLEKVRCILNESGLPKSFWSECLQVATYLRNRSPAAGINTTPYQALFGIKPDLTHVKTIGSTCYYKILDNQGDKLSNVGRKGYLVGYQDGSKAYRILDEKSRKIIISRDVTIDEESKYANKV